MIFGIPSYLIASQVVPMLAFFVIWVIVVVVLRVSKKKDLTFLVLFTVFYFYIYAVLNLTLFQFQALIILKGFLPGLILNGQPPGQEINLIPLITLTGADVKTSLLNILMMIPFGMGLPLLSKFNFVPILISGFLTSLAIELLQWTSGLLGGTWFRIADINDVLFNTLGVAIGYTIFFIGKRILRTLLTEGQRKTL